MAAASAEIGTTAWLRGVYPSGGRCSVPADRVRCACRRCGSHVHAVVLKQIISGLCTTCGSCDIASLST